MLTALGGCETQLEVHVNAALNVGLSPDEIVESLHSAVYCGIPKAMNASLVAKKVFAERGCCRRAAAHTCGYRCLIRRKVTEFAGKV